MIRNAYVVDASVILKWVLPKDISPLQEQALSIRNALAAGEIKVIVPALWRYEVGNTLGRLIPKHALELLTQCVNVGVREAIDSEVRDKKAFELMDNWQVSFYDATYHALAIVNDIDFVTADDKYRNKTKQQGNVLALKDWQK